jgi:hypothetical protein
MSQKFRKLVREEYSLMVEEVKKKSPDIEKKLEDLRKKLIPEIIEGETEKRVGISMVAQIIDVPLGELMLYFMNVTKNGLTDAYCVEYHLGQVYFRPDAD